MKMKRTTIWIAALILVLGTAFARQALPLDTLDVGVETRYRVRSSNDGDDVDWYFYGKVLLNPTGIGNSYTATGSARYRLAYDTDGLNDDLGPAYYQPWRSLEDVERGSDDYSHRLYHAFLRIDSDFLVDHTLVLGRQYLHRGERLWFDGGALKVSPGRHLNLIAYGGIPVSFWFDTEDTSLLGGGIDIMPYRGSSWSLDTFAVEDSDFRNEVYNLRIEQELFLDGLELHASARYVDDEFQEYEVSPRYYWRMAKLTFLVKFSQVVNPIEDEAFPIAMLIFPLGELSERTNTDFSITRGGKWFGLTIGYTINDADEESYANIDYDRIYSRVRVNLAENTTVTIDIEQWKADGDETLRSGAEFNHSKKLWSLWAGTRFDKFDYDIETGAIDEDVQTYYCGAAIHLKNITLGVDFEGEDGDSEDAPYYIFQGHAGLEF